MPIYDMSTRKMIAKPPPGGMTRLKFDKNGNLTECYNRMILETKEDGTPNIPTAEELEKAELDRQARHAEEYEHYLKFFNSRTPVDEWPIPEELKETKSALKKKELNRKTREARKAKKAKNLENSESKDSEDSEVVVEK